MSAKIKVRDVFRGARVRKVPLMGDSPFIHKDVYIGVEVEIENAKSRGSSVINPSDITELEHAGWTTHTDNSLINGMEFVFSEPLFGAGAYRALKVLDEKIVFNPTARASMHVHLDWGSVDDAYSLCTLAALLYCYEPAIFAMVGAGRKSNNYCRPLESVGTQALVPLFVGGPLRFTDTYLNGAAVKGNEDYRYFGANFVALAKFGTVEFRYFPSPSSLEEMVRWVNLCLCLRHMAISLSPLGTDVLERLSSEDTIVGTLHEFIPDTALVNALLNVMDVEDAAERMRIMALLVKADPSAEQKARVPSKAYARYVETLPVSVKRREQLEHMRRLREALVTNNVTAAVDEARAATRF